ncbi:hypothetical protein [Paenibacillus ehimensis]|uniref:hypothetical protein n=1 Tax=Paenibacillus ehimensis TaxID=79264 RepID=UPI000FDC3905|nr:hypothetical protein [Paenibacillus ehimensis]
MELAISIALSTLETVTIFVLIMVSFRYRQSYRLLAVASLGLVLAVFSLWARMVLMQPIVDNLFQLFAMCIYLKFVYRIRWFDASIMLCFGCLMYLLLQGLVVLFFKIGYGYFLEDYHDITSYQTFMLQMVTFPLGLGIAWIIKKKNGGFTFISSHMRRRAKWTGINRSILGSLICSGVLLIVGLISTGYGNQLTYYTFFSFLFIFFVYLVLLFYRKDYLE